METLKKLGSAFLTCTFAICGAGIGAVAGALKGQTTETGIVRGAVIGSFAGVVVAVELLESCLQGLQGELLEKMAIFGSILNGKVFREWVSSALLIAYDEQVSTVETSYVDTSDLFDISRSKGLLLEMINKLPEFYITGLEFAEQCEEPLSCAICLQDFNCGEKARRLPTCGHFFHLLCVDKWLVRHGSCPLCRKEV
ncbi:hypothetical protein IEQ34_016495 [Dendrobium chrysotoxum]|uniref:RING-type domain-containing protein n=1 Tax=Dendrobium chrysotoxum TaxID=161865 RepID=A0AAV7GDM7_DENCH|nr:hypothetical protein IEQ34_016495 [Dendrobium chrysotoxum]